MFGRRKIAALVAEFLGTGVLTLLILSVQHSQIGLPFFIALAAGLTFTLMSLAVSAVSGGHFNPAITFGAWTVRKISTVTAILYVAFQFLGAWAAYHLYTYYLGTSLHPIVSQFHGNILVAEAVGAAIFAFALLNPAVALGVRSWVLGTYILGPVLGAVVGFNLYSLLFTDSGLAKVVAVFNSSPSTTVKKSVVKKKSVTKK